MSSRATLRGVGADGDDVADRLVDHGVGHRLRVVLAVPRVDADTDGEAVRVAGVGHDHAIARPVAVASDERPHHGAPADLVVVAVDRGRLRGDVRVSQQGQHGRGRIVDAALDGLASRLRQLGNELALGSAVVEERGLEVEHDVAAVAHDEASVAGEGAEVGQLDTVPAAASLQRRQLVGRDGDDHPLLCLRQPDLPWLEARGT